MSTRSILNVKCSDGKVRSIYCHFDGDTRLPILKKYYNSQELAEDLVSMGDMSSLAENMTCPEGHNFDHPEKGYCVFYYRDRHEPWADTKPNVYNTLKEAWEQTHQDQEYVYEYDNGWKRYKYNSARYSSEV